MNEKLLDYLLNTLDHSEKEEIDRALQLDAQIRQKLEAYREGLASLEEDRAEVEAPDGLAARTCARVREQHGPRFRSV